MGLMQIGSRRVVTVSPDTKAKEVACLMNDRSLGSIVVVEGDKPVGIVTDRDLVLRVMCKDLDAKTLTARDVMSAPLKTVPRDAGPLQASTHMREAEVRRLPIVDEYDNLVGIVTLDDLLFYLSSAQYEMTEAIAAFPIEHHGG